MIHIKRLIMSGVFFVNKYLQTSIKYCNYFFIFAYRLKKPNSMKLNKANFY